MAIPGYTPERGTFLINNSKWSKRLFKSTNEMKVFLKTDDFQYNWGTKMPLFSIYILNEDTPTSFVEALSENYIVDYLIPEILLKSNDGMNKPFKDVFDAVFIEDMFVPKNQTIVLPPSVERNLYSKNYGWFRYGEKSINSDFCIFAYTEEVDESKEKKVKKRKNNVNIWCEKDTSKIAESPLFFKELEENRIHEKLVEQDAYLSNKQQIKGLIRRGTDNFSSSPPPIPPIPPIPYFPNFVKNKLITVEDSIKTVQKQKVTLIKIDSNVKIIN